MKLLSLALITTLVSTALAGFNGKKIAATVDRQATKLRPGKYRFVNVASRKGLKYVRKGQALFAAPGKGDWISIKIHHNHVVISPTSSNNKCASAAWSYKQGANAYAALYACKAAKFKRDGLWKPGMQTRDVLTNSISFDHLEEKRDETNHTLERRKKVALRTDKQMFYVHRGHIKHTYHIVAYDHIKDMKTRVVSDRVVNPEWVKKGSPVRYAALVDLNEKDKHQLWYIYNSKGKLQ